MAKNKKFTDTIFLIVLLVAASGFFLAIIEPVRQLDGFDYFRKGSVFLLCLAGIGVGIANGIRDYKQVIVSIILFLLILLSMKTNDTLESHTFSLACIILYLFGINESMPGGKQAFKAIAILFAVFDLLCVLSCYYIYCFENDMIAEMKQAFANPHLSDKSCLFYNSNSAGIMAGIAVVLFLALLMHNQNVLLRILLAVAALLNVVFLIDSDCRSAQTGVIITILVYLVKRWTGVSTKKTVMASFIVCMLAIVSLFAFVYTTQQNDSLTLSDRETAVDIEMSGRYSLWKTQLLAQQDNLLLGFGSIESAVDQRIAYVGEISKEDPDSRVARIGGNKKFDTHNGYLGILSTFGLLGLLGFALRILSDLHSWNESFAERQELAFLLVFIFWINLFENLMIVSKYFTCFLLFILLVYFKNENNGVQDN